VILHGIACPGCGGSHIRRARYRDKKERLRALLGVYPFRCRECGTRFLAGVLMLRRLLYAKCPRCLRTDLTTWSPHFYQASLLQNTKLVFGGQRYRCSVCRYNFVSFRPRKRTTEGAPETTPEQWVEEEQRP
jgi:rubrerythrin